MSNLNTILLVEDNLNDAELTIQALTSTNLGNKVTLVRDGVEALEYLQYEGKYTDRKKENPVVILLDIKMPRLNGIEVLKIVKNSAELKTIPIVMLTSSREDPDLKLCYELGVNAYVVKPVDFKDFLETIKQVGIFWALINEIPFND